MHDDQLRVVIQRLLSDHAEDLDCTAVVDIIARYVDLEVAGDAPGLDLPGIPIHLDLCPHCAEMYEALSQVARLEACGQLPDVDALWHELAVLAGAPPAAVPATLPSSDAGRAPPQPAIPAPAWAADTPRSDVARAVRPGWALRSGWTRDLRPMAAAQAALAVAAAAAGVAWWHARAEAVRMTTALEQTALQHHAEMAEISQMSSDAFASEPDGSWTRVLFDPGRDRAVLFAGNLPPLADGEWIECWLKKPDGRADLAGRFDDVEPTLNYWLLAAGGPVRQDTTLVVTIEPSHRPLFEVPLVPDDAAPAAAAAPTTPRR